MIYFGLSPYEPAIITMVKVGVECIWDFFSNARNNIALDN
jgi:hypothetical protein